MNREEERETVIARLISNTRRKKRPNSLVEIGRDIRWLQNDLGSLKAVSETIRISPDMLWQFLSVEKLSPEVKKLVEERKIDLINTVHYMRSFDAESQKAIAKEINAGRLSAEDIRVLAPLKRNFPDLTIDRLISRVQKSRNIKVYIAYFQISPGFNNIGELRKRFEKIVGKAEIISFDVKGLVGTLELSAVGQKKLKEAAKESNLSLRKFVDMIVRG